MAPRFREGDRKKSEGDRKKSEGDKKKSEGASMKSVKHNLGCSAIIHSF